MALTPGTRLGVYEVTARIGEGGMGQVYRARDTKLNRDVAVKILPGNFADDPDRLARFTREAQTLASLNHLNIAHIHGIEESGGVRALVLELVEGEDLAERLARGPIPLDEALPIARQIAEALEAAHEQGIIHRDLKPANIKVRADGTVKVLDFGLAKAMEPAGLASPSLAHSPTITTPAHLRQAYGGQAMTQAGIILGTAAYMAPEQARGKGVDKRADVWAFGVVLYEMLTGRSLFKGDTVTDVLAAVVTREPDWTALPAGVPRAVRRLLRRCLEKDPRLRLRDIGDARIELTAPVDSDIEAQPASVPPARSSRRSWMWIAGMAAAAIVGTVVGRLAFRPPPVESPLVSFELSVPDVPTPAISPDGSRIAFTSGGRLHIRELGRLTATDLPGTEGANSPFWSPDSTTIGFGANGKLWRISAAGGPPAVICNLPTTTWDDDAGGAWLPDGTIVFTTGGSSLMRVAAVGADPAVVVEGNAESRLHFHDARALPDGRGVLFVTHRKEGADTLELWANGENRQLLRLEGHSLYDPVYTPSGHVLFTRRPSNPGLWAVPFSLQRLELTGAPFLVVPGAGRPSVSHSGRLVYVPDAETAPPARLVWFSREGKELGRIDEPRIMDSAAPVFSPDGTRAAVSVRTADKWDIWVFALKSGAGTRVTSDGAARRPQWSPDGTTIVYHTGSGPSSTVKRAAADGSGHLDEIGQGRDPIFSSDGQQVMYEREFDIFSRPIRGGVEAAVLTGPTTDAVPRPSPDGRFLAFMTVTPTQIRVSVTGLSSATKRWEVPVPESGWPRWSRDGRRLFFATAGDVQEVDVHTELEFRIGIPRRLFAHPGGPSGGSPVPFDVSGDGERFLMVKPDRSLSVPRAMVVVLNFTPVGAQR